jgi:DNA-binding MarR family transcriptional regulator
LARFHLTTEQAAVLRLIGRVDRGVTAKEIQDATLRQQHTISILLNRMARSGLVTRKRRPGERESRINLTKGGHTLLDEVGTASLKEVFSVLSRKERRHFACSLRALRERARGLLVPDVPPFMRHLAGTASAGPAGRDDGGGGTFSDYLMWSSLDAARFAISRLRELELSPFGLTVEQASILKVLSDRSVALAVKDLEDITLRQHHSISALVNRMIGMGLLARQKTEGERSHRVFVTGAGRDLFERITTAAIDMVFTVLTDREKQQLNINMHSLYTMARSLLEDPGASPDLGHYREF